MPEITLKIPCEAYLAQWYVNESGGTSPVKLKKNSPEQHLLRCLLVSKNSVSVTPPDNTPEEGTATAGAGSADGAQHPCILEIIIPYFKGMPPEVYNHIRARGEKVFTDTLRKRFDLQLFEDVAPLLPAVDRKDELLWAWMEAHGIEATETNWAAVEKRLRRLIERMRTKVRVREFRKKRSEQK